ncbi:F-box family protein [Euphorbia peplus]|nr:F-box family protein [Euphorbia peplus]
MTQGNYIPDNIVEILTKLPLKSVLRFKIACKTWYSLISDPGFIDLHSKRTSQNPKVLYSSANSEYQLQLLDYDSSSFDDCCLSGPINFSYCRFNKIIGSSCGLICVDIDYDLEHSFCLWNPITRECRELPTLDMISIDYDDYYFHGLGYDSVGNDFKLVISIDRIRYNIFSLNVDSWKTITCPVASEYYHPDAVQYEDLLHEIMPWNSLAVVLKGVFHWLVVPANNGPEIVAFDIGSETFQKLQLPLDLYRADTLLEQRGHLCVSGRSLGSSPTVMDIWMMKEEHDGWVHLLSIMNVSNLDCFVLPVLCIFTGNEVVFHTDEKVSMCGREEEEDFTACLYRGVLYVETLVSPYTEDWLQKRRFHFKVSIFFIFCFFLFIALIMLF